MVHPGWCPVRTADGHKPLRFPNTTRLTKSSKFQLPFMALFRLSALDWVCFALLLVGALNWGLVGLLEINAVEALLEPVFQSAAAELVVRGIYVLVGLAGLYFFYPLYRISQRAQD